MSAQRQNGVTLPEILIALLVLAMISGAAVYALRLSVEGREQLETTDNAIKQLQIARIVLREDLAQVAPRIRRDEFGQDLPGAFLGGAGIVARATQNDERALLSFVRRGWANEADVAPRPTLQSVDYILVGDKLVRRTRVYLDAASKQPFSDRTMLEGVTQAEIAFSDGVNNSGEILWLDLWPSPVVKGGYSPKAVRLTLTTKRFGTVEQLFYIGEL